MCWTIKQIRVQIVYNNGPNIEPCGSPVLINLREIIWPLNLTHSRQSFKYELVFISCLMISQGVCKETKTVWFIRSKALLDCTKAVHFLPSYVLIMSAKLEFKCIENQNLTENIEICSCQKSKRNCNWSEVSNVFMPVFLGNGDTKYCFQYWHQFIYYQLMNFSLSIYSWYEVKLKFITVINVILKKFIICRYTENSC